MKRLLKDEGGQSAVEFILIAPFLFLILFAVIQLAYMSYVSLAVQRAALAVARTATLSGTDNSKTFKTQLAISLFPLSNLNSKTLLTILASKISVTVSRDKKNVIAQVRYPMPIWVPMVSRIFGEPLVPSFDYNNSPEGQAIQKIFQLFNQPAPNLSFQGVSLPVCWVKYEETTFNEAYRPNR
jgi:hypothetical protein